MELKLNYTIWHLKYGKSAYTTKVWIGFHLKIQNAILKARKVSGIRGASPNIKSFFQEKVLDYLRNAKRNTRRY